MWLLPRSRHQPIGADRHGWAAEEALDRGIVAIMGDDSDLAVVLGEEVENRFVRRLAVRIGDPGSTGDVGEPQPEIAIANARFHASDLNALQTAAEGDEIIPALGIV